MIGQSLPTLEENPYIPTMLKNPIFHAVGAALLLPLGVWAQDSAPKPAPGAAPAPKAEAPAEPPTEAEKMLDEAIKKVAALKSVSADLVQKVEMLDQNFRVEGRYLKAPEHRVYLKLTVKGLADSAGTTLQVCDGKTLWDYQQVLETPIYRKLDVVKVFEQLDSPDIDTKLRDQVVSQLGFAGPETLLVGLRRTIKFKDKEEGTLDGVAVWKLHGEWKNRDGLLGPNQQPLPETAPLPPYVPSVVSIWIGKDDGWPYRLLLLGKSRTILEDNRPVGQDGKRIGSKNVNNNQKIQPTKIDLSYTNVKLNPALKIEQFVFQAPPDARVEDNTEPIVGMLQSQIRVEASKRKAAESGETTLDKALQLPQTPQQ